MDAAKLNLLGQSIQDAVAQGKRNLEHAQSKEPFRIVVCGAFSTGKTSLINALLGCELPTGMRPITKVVTCIRYGVQNAIILEDTWTGQKQGITPQRADEIILNQQKKSEYRYYRVYYELPSEFLKNGVEFLDTPGFEDDAEEKLDDMTKQAIREADFCIVTFASNSFGTMNERQFLNELQALSNGNFICVLNCMNRVHSQEQLDDLQEQARIILRDGGNERIGMGRYFMVDSDRDSEEKYLDGLDRWLKDLLKHEAVAIRTDAAVSRALSVLSPKIEEGNRAFHELQQEFEWYMLAREKNLISQCHSMSVSSSSLPQKLKRIKTEFFGSLDYTFCATLRKRLSQIPERNYNEKASNVIGNMILEFSNQLERKMRQAFPNYAVSDPWDQIKKSTFQWTKRTTWTTTKSMTEYMSDGLKYGLWDWDNYHTNGYVAETIKDTESKTIPEIKKYVNEYFTMVESKLLSQECSKLLSARSADQTAYETQSNILAEQLIQACLLLSKLQQTMAN